MEDAKTCLRSENSDTAFFAQTDTVNAFVDACLEPGRSLRIGQRARVTPTQNLHTIQCEDRVVAIYFYWCYQRDITPLSGKNFVQRLRVVCLARFNTDKNPVITSGRQNTKGEVWKGVKLRPDFASIVLDVG